jgi:hypothetical protein
MNMDERLRITFTFFFLFPIQFFHLLAASLPTVTPFYITDAPYMHRRAASTNPSQRYLAIPRLMSYHPSHAHSPSNSNTLFLSLIDIFRPRKARLRATFFCLFSLIIITTYVCLVSPRALSPGHPYHSKLGRLDESWRKFAPNLPTIPRSRPSSSALPDILLSPEQELSALTAFMAALPQNVIPTNIDPAQPIDPQLVLDFDTRSPQAEQEMDDLVIDVWIGNPVVLFSKVREHPALISLRFDLLSHHGQFHSSVSRELKSILSAMDLQPPPTIFDVDQRGMCFMPIEISLNS